jgi:hypothetical protein
MTKPKCHFCNDTGSIAIRSRDGMYAFAGPVPDDAKGYADADCWYCDCAKHPSAGRRSPDRSARNPGGCECLKCGTIFIGEEWHTECARCLAPPDDGPEYGGPQDWPGDENVP